MAKDKLIKFYSDNITRSRHSISSKKKQETEEAKTAVTLNYRDLCAKWNLNPSEASTWEQIETGVKMQWIKQKKLPKKKYDLAAELGLPEVA
eukprot:7867360-Pyramimonas_sp.AAC.1